MFTKAWDKVCEVSREANLFGVNLPMVKDPKTGCGSVSLTLVCLSSLLVIAGLVGKWSGYLGTVDINHALEFFYASSALYFGRKWTSKPSKNSDSGSPGSGTKQLPAESNEDSHAG